MLRATLPKRLITTSNHLIRRSLPPLLTKNPIFQTRGHSDFLSGNGPAVSEYPEQNDCKTLSKFIKLLPAMERHNHLYFLRMEEPKKSAGFNNILRDDLFKIISDENAFIELLKKTKDEKTRFALYKNFAWDQKDILSEIHQGNSKSVESFKKYISLFDKFLPNFFKLYFVSASHYIIPRKQSHFGSIFAMTKNNFDQLFSILTPNQTQCFRSTLDPLDNLIKLASKLGARKSEKDDAASPPKLSRIR